MMTKKCSNCLWFDMCGDDKPCDNYSPANEQMEDAEKEESYKKDLKMRNELYNEELIELEVIECQ